MKRSICRFGRPVRRCPGCCRPIDVANTSEGSGFARLIATGELRDNLALEGSIGWFVGEGRDLVGRFADSDFIYLRLKHYF
jgi:hypothetical protein